MRHSNELASENACLWVDKFSSLTYNLLVILKQQGA